MTSQTILPNSADPKYYKNCRGVNYLPIMRSEWEKSGWLPRYPLTSVFGAVNPGSVYDASQSFQGTNKTSQWWYYNHDDNDHCVGMLRSIGINALRVFLDIYVWQRNRTQFIANIRDFLQICDKHKVRVQFVIWDGIQLPAEYLGSLPQNRTDTSASVEHGLISVWLPQPLPFEVSSVAQAQNFFTTCATPYLADICSSVSSFQSLWSFDLMNEAAGSISSLTSSTGLYLASSLSSIGIGLTFGHGSTYDQFSGTLYGGGNTVYPNLITRLSSVINFASIHPYQVNTYAISRDIVNEALSGHAILGLPSMYNEGSNNASLNWSYKNVEYFNSGLNYGGLLFDGLVDFANSYEPFRDSQGILFWDGTAKNIKEPNAYVSLAQSCGWMKGSQLNRNVQQKDISTDNGTDGGYYSGTISEHQSFNSELYTSATLAKWTAAKTWVYTTLVALGLERSEISKNYVPYAGHPMQAGYGFGHAASGYEVSTLVTICSSYSTYFPALSSYSRSIFSGTDFIQRDRELYLRDLILDNFATNIFVTRPQVRDLIIGTQWDRNLIPSATRLSFSSHYYQSSRTDGNSIAISIGSFLPTTTSASFPCVATSSCFYINDIPQQGIDWDAYDTWYDTAFTRANTCLNYYLSSTYDNRLY